MVSRQLHTQTLLAITDASIELMKAVVHDMNTALSAHAVILLVAVQSAEVASVLVGDAEYGAHYSGSVKNGSLMNLGLCLFHCVQRAVLFSSSG